MQKSKSTDSSTDDEETTQTINPNIKLADEVQPSDADIKEYQTMLSKILII